MRTVSLNAQLVMHVIGQVSDGLATTPGLGSIDCVGDAACRGIEFPIPNPTVAVSETCSNQYECANATFICPTDATCHVQCHYDWSCFGLTIWRPFTTQMLKGFGVTFLVA
eukprot:807248_1